MRRFVLWAGVIAVTACTERLPRPLQIDRVEPDAVSAGAPATLRIVGRFEVDVRVSFDDRSNSSFDSAFGVAMGLMPATSVRWIDHTAIEATFAAAPSIGVYDLSVTAPDGRTVTGPQMVTSRSGPVDCTGDGQCADPCYTIYSCVAGACQYGIADKDSDGDGFVDAACTGGDDCDDDPGGCGNGCAPSIPDVCDGFDNDCDPSTPDGAVLLGTPCDGDDADLCEDDQITGCSGTTPVCSSGADNPDICDDVDNDCNPATADGDADPALGSACDGADTDLCTDDTVTGCAAGVLVCSAGADDGEGPNGDATCTDSVDNDCDGATDAADAGCGSVNTPPAVVVALTPALLEVGATLSGDASQSSDREDATGSLTVAWDWQGDGTFDDSGLTATQSYATAGERTVVVRVTDTGGLSATQAFSVFVVDVGTLITISTAEDENDGGATPVAPGGTGLSLREALSYANATAGIETILVPSETTIVLGAELPALTGTQGVTLVADGAVVDGTGIPTCLAIGADDVTLIGLEIRGCTSLAVQLTGDRARLERVRIRGDGGGVFVNGVGTVLGPGVDITVPAGSTGIQSGEPVTVTDSRISGGDRGIFLAVGAGGSVLVGNVLAGAVEGISVGVQVDGTLLAHNTIVGATSSGIRYTSNADGGVLVNNIFANNELAVSGADGNFATLDFNAWSANAGGDCSSCSSLGANAVTDPPLFVDAGAGDYRLLQGSPAIDAGTDWGFDRNGPDSGLFSGTAPDIGAWEAP